MAELLKAKEPFHFYTRLCLSELTGLRASTLSQLAGLLKDAPDSCIYHHTHRFPQQHQNFTPEAQNDFAWWAGEALKELSLAEKLAAIDAMQFSDIGALREKIIRVIEDFLSANPLAKLSFARAGEEFYLMKSVSFILPDKHA